MGREERRDVGEMSGALQARAMMAAGARHYTHAHLTAEAAAATLEAIAGRTQRPATPGSSRWGQRR